MGTKCTSMEGGTKSPCLMVQMEAWRKEPAMNLLERDLVWRWQEFFNRQSLSTSSLITKCSMEARDCSSHGERMQIKPKPGQNGGRRAWSFYFRLGWILHVTGSQYMMEQKVHTLSLFPIWWSLSMHMPITATFLLASPMKSSILQMEKLLFRKVQLHAQVHTDKK